MRVRCRIMNDFNAFVLVFQHRVFLTTICTGARMNCLFAVCGDIIAFQRCSSQGNFIAVHNTGRTCSTFHRNVTNHTVGLTVIHLIVVIAVQVDRSRIDCQITFRLTAAADSPTVVISIACQGRFDQIHRRIHCFGICPVVAGNTLFRIAGLIIGYTRCDFQLNQRF